MFLDLPMGLFQAKKTASGRQMFTKEEDTILKLLVQKYGPNSWKTVAEHMQTRNVRQCRERYKNYLAPGVNKAQWTEEEDQFLLVKYSQLGPQWTKIACFFDARTDVGVKNRFNYLSTKYKTYNPIANGDYKTRKLNANFLKNFAAENEFYDIQNSDQDMINEINRIDEGEDGNDDSKTTQNAENTVSTEEKEKNDVLNSLFSAADSYHDGEISDFMADYLVW